jgi:alcohol dehydrogenase (cytochrome c)
MTTDARLTMGILGAVACAALTGAAQAPQSTTPPPPVPMILQNYKPVTAADLLNPASGDWRMVRRTYDGWGYSPLDQISTSNVARLQPAWVVSTGVTSGHQAPPILHGGVMFVATPSSQVLALDAKTGQLLWRYRAKVPEDTIMSHQTSRGVAVYGDKVFLAAGNAVLVAINARTGQEAWTAKVEENRNGYYMSLAPLVAEGKIMVGTSGSDRGVRGFVAAFDVETGKEAWRTYTVPAPGEPGSETWPAGGNEWKTGAPGSGWPGTTIRKHISRTGAPQTASPGLAIAVLATTSTRRQRLPSTSPPASSKGIINIIRTIRGIGTRCRRRFSWITGVRTGPSRGW